MTMKRDPDATRRAILEAAFWEIYRNGFQAASLDGILRQTGVTKGALYYHFPNKKALGLAVIDEVILPHFREHWFTPLRNTEDPVEGIQKAMSKFPDKVGAEAMVLGCPLNNLAQEMSPIDEDFRHHIESIFNSWRTQMADALDRGKEGGFIRPDVDAARVATFIIASHEGATSLAKNAQDMSIIEACFEGLASYLETLRPAGVVPSPGH